MDKNTTIGFLLIALIIIGFALINKPSEEEIARQRHYNDSIALVQQQRMAAEAARQEANAALQAPAQGLDSASLQAKLADAFGAFSPAATGTDTCYVLERRQLLGCVSAVDLLTAEESAAVTDLMTADTVSVGTLTDREEAARLLAKYDLLALPVLDGEGRMVGIVTVDDAMDVLAEEAAEDLTIMAAVTPDERPYFAASAWEHARRLRLGARPPAAPVAADPDALRGRHRRHHHPV